MININRIVFKEYNDLEDDHYDDYQQYLDGEASIVDLFKDIKNEEKDIVIISTPG